MFVAICVTVPDAALGQQVTAAITGKITDPSDAAIAGARVEAKDIARGTVWTAESDVEGFYSLPRVPVGRYEARVEMAGFSDSGASAVRAGAQPDGAAGFSDAASGAQSNC